MTSNNCNLRSKQYQQKCLKARQLEMFWLGKYMVLRMPTFCYCRTYRIYINYSIPYAVVGRTYTCAWFEACQLTLQYSQFRPKFHLQVKHCGYVPHSSLYTDNLTMVTSFVSATTDIILCICEFRLTCVDLVSSSRQANRAGCVQLIHIIAYWPHARKSNKKIRYTYFNHSVFS